MATGANRVEAFAVTVARNTAKAAAVTTQTAFQDGIVTRIELDVPNGHAGYTGIQILCAKGQVVPFTAGTFLVANDHNFGWDLVGQLDTGAWSVSAYNTDVYAHTFYVRFNVLDFGYVVQPAALPPLSPTPLLV